MSYTIEAGAGSGDFLLVPKPEQARALTATEVAMIRHVAHDQGNHNPRVAAIRMLRSVFGMDLRDAKAAVDLLAPGP